MSVQHTPATTRIQRRLERWELDHLRTHTAGLADRIEQLEARVQELEREVSDAEACADMWRDSHNRLAEHLRDGTADARCIGLTPHGDLLVVHTRAMQ